MNAKRLLPLVVLPLLIAGCGSSGKSSSASPSTTAAAQAGKVAFCKDNDALNAAGKNVSTPDAILGALKANLTTIQDMAKVAPPEIAVDAQVLVTTSQAAISANSVAAFNDPKFLSAVTKVDSFCGSGAAETTTTPSTAAAAAGGDKTAFCQDNADLTKAFSAATSVADLVGIVKANVTKIADFAKNTPTDIAADAGVLVTAAATVSASGDGTAFTDAKVQAAGSKVDAYCGQTPTAATTTTV